MQWCHLVININVYKSHNAHFCASSHRFSHINVANVWSWKFRSSSQSTMITVVTFDGKYMTSYLMAILMFALSITIYKIFTNQTKCQVWPWKCRSLSRKRKKGLAPFNWKYSICDFFQNFTYLGIYLYANWWSTCTHTQREMGVMTISKNTFTPKVTHIHIHAHAHVHNKWNRLNRRTFTNV